MTKTTSFSRTPRWVALLSLALCALALAPRTWARFEPELLHTFGTGSDGGSPTCELLQGADGAFYGTAPYGGAHLGGTAFKVNADGTGFTVLHDFDPATTGREPQAGLLKASNGFLYGTTYRNGPGSYGTLYRMNGDGTGLTVIYNFSYATGAFVRKALVEGADGKLYGVAQYGGSYGEGVIFRIDPDGTNYTVLKTLDSSSGSASECGLMFASDGQLYGMGTYRGTNDSGTVFRMGADGFGFEVLVNFNRNVTGGYPNATLAEGSDGMLYGTTRFGGTNDKGVVFKVNKNGTGFTIIQHLSDTIGANPVGRLLKLASGDIYGTTQSGGANAGGVLFKLSGGGTTYSVVKEFHYNGSTAGGLSAGVVLGSDGKLYGTGAQYGAFGGGGLYRVNTDGTGYETLHDFLNGADIEAEGGFPVGQLLRGLDGAYYGANSEGGANGDGTLFKINADGSGFVVLKHLESAVTGDTPYGGLIQTPDGKLYGTTAAGGGMNGGTLFRVDPDGTDFEVLVQFDWFTTGGGPRGQLLLGQDGKIYGATAYGSDPGYGGAIFKVNTDGTGLTILKSLTSSTEGYYSEGGLSQGPDGTLYGCATYGGGETSEGTIYKLNPDGTGFAVLKSGNFFSSGANPGGAPVVGNDGALYGCMTGGGNNYAGVLYRMNTDGTGYTVLRNFAYGTGGGPRGTLVKAADGSLYGWTQYGGAGEGGVAFKTNPDGTGFTVLASLAYLTHGRAVQGALTFGPEGNIYAMAQSGGALDSGTVLRLLYIPNTAPDAPALSSNTVPEPAGSFYNIGTLGPATDIDGDAVTYSLVDEGTFPDNASFFISGQTLRPAGPVDYETKNSYSIRVRASDGTADTDATLTVLVTDENDQPTGVSFANTVSIVENTVIAAPVKVADIVVVDDALGSNSLGLAGANASSFTIVGTELFLNAGVSLDFETRPSLRVTVNVDDYSVGSSPDASAVFTLTVLDDGVNEGAYGVALSGTNTGTIGSGVSATNYFYGYGQSFTPAVGGSAASGGAIGAGSTVTLSGMFVGFYDDGYASSVVYLYSSLPSQSDLNSGIGALATGTLVSGRNYSFPDVPLNSSQTYYVLAPYATYFRGDGDTYAGGTGLVDYGGGQIGDYYYDVAFTATFGGVGLTNLPENADTSSAIKLADIAVLDDALGSNTITLSGTDAASFTRIGNELFLAAGTVLDHETKPALTVTIEVDDSAIAGSPDFSQVFTLTIRNVNEAPAGTNKTVTTPVSTPYAFTKADFGFTDPSDAPNANSFDRVKITTLPVAGTLTVNGSPVNAGDIFEVNSAVAGETWTEAFTGPSNWAALASSADGTKLVAAPAYGQIHTSADSGTTWTAVGPEGSWTALASSADGTKLVAVQNGGQIFTSNDSGATWTARADARSWYSVASSADGTKLAAGVGYYPDYIYISNDSGETWTATTAYGSWTALAMSADGSKIYAGDAGYYNYYGGYLWRSSDSGATWTNGSDYTTWQSIACSSDGSKLVAAGGDSYYGGRLYTSADSGATLTQGPSGYWKAVASSADGNKLLAVDAGYYHYYGGPAFTSSDAGATWVQRSPYGTFFAAASSADGAKLAIANIYGAISTSIAPPVHLPVFTPVAGAEASPYASFTFQVEDNGGTADGGVNLDPTANVMTINVGGATPNTPPVLNLPASPVIAEATSAAGAVVNFSVTATDAEDDPDPTVTANPPSGSTFPLGDTTVNVSATDSGSATTNGSFTVRVQDTTAPTVAPHLDVIVDATSVAGAVVTYDPASANDAVGVASITYSQDSGTTFPIGMTTVAITARDAANNEGTGSFTVTVNPLPSAPTAADDFAFANNTKVVIDVLGNDTTPSGGLSIAGVTAPPGAKTKVEGGKVVFIPLSPVTAATTFTYTVTNGAGTDSATVTVRPFSHAAGTYVGLLRREDNSVRGRVIFTATTLGQMTGQLRYEGRSYVLKGGVNWTELAVTGTLPQPKPAVLGRGEPDALGQPTFTLTVPDSIVGQSLTGTFERSPYSASNPTTQSGLYTVIAELPSGGTGPALAAAMTCSVTSAGTVKFGGKTGNGVTVAQAGKLLNGGRLPFFVSSGSGAAMQGLSGELVFNRSGTPDVTGTLHWAVPTGTLRLAAGVDQDYDVKGQAYTAGPSASAMFSPAAPSATITLEIPSLGLGSPVVRTLPLTGAAVRGSQQVFMSAPGSGNVIFKPGTGYFSGQRVTTGATTRNFFGVVLQIAGESEGRGMLLDAAALDEVTIAP